jgi:hypothetical protein
MESEWESGLWIFIRHLGSLIFGKATIQCLKKSAGLVLVYIGTGENYDGFVVIEGRACCRFSLCQFMILNNVSWKLLCKEIPPEALMQMDVEPHVNKPPRASQIADGFT